jgi:hypothetical protein
MRVLVVAHFFVFAIGGASAGARQGWRTQQDPEFGFWFSYPEEIFRRNDLAWSRIAELNGRSKPSPEHGSRPPR